MTVKTEGKHAGECIISEANGSYSRDTGTLTSGQKLEDGTVLCLVGGKLVIADGSTDSAGALNDTFAGILIGNWDASATGKNADIAGVPYLARSAEVKLAALTLYSGSTGSVQTKIKAKLLAMGLVQR